MPPPSPPFLYKIVLATLFQKCSVCSNWGSSITICTLYGIFDKIYMCCSQESMNSIKGQPFKSIPSHQWYDSFIIIRGRATRKFLSMRIFYACFVH